MASAEGNADAKVSASEAMMSRYSCRAYESTEVPMEVVEDILKKASSAPSGGEAKAELTKACFDAVEKGEKIEPVTAVYPDKVPGVKLGKQFIERRRKTGYQLYDAVGIKRKDGLKKMKQMMENYNFFGAPVGIIITSPTDHFEMQWLDIGCFLQNIWLLAVERKLGFIAQGAFTAFGPIVHRTLKLPAEEKIVCGGSLGFPIHDAAINSYRTERASLNVFATFVSKL